MDMNKTTAREDEIARETLELCGVPGAPDTAKMTAQGEKHFQVRQIDGHTA